jgi:hypothetical protein
MGFSTFLEVPELPQEFPLPEQGQWLYTMIQALTTSTLIMERGLKQLLPRRLS